MKKRTIAAAVLLAALTSCQNEVLEVPELEEGFVIKAKVENYATDTKSSVTDAGVFSWIKGDAIGVYNGTTFQSYYAQEAAASASFTGEASTSLQKVAVSPAALSPVVADGALNKITLPSEYEWVKDQTNIPMVAEFDNISDSLTFKYLGGLFKVQLKGVPATATKFVFTADKDITGEYTIATDDDLNKIIETAGSESNKSVTFTFSLTEAQDMDFYIPVPVGEYKTVTIGVYQSDGTPIITKTGTNTHNIARKGLRIINAITISNIDAGGEDGEKDITVASSHEGTYYLPSTTATLNVYMEENVHAVSLVYTDENADCPATVNIICKGNIGNATAGTGLTVNLPKSHVNVKGEVDGTNVIILQSLTSSTSASTLVLENTVKIADKLTVAKGSATIGCEVPTVTVTEKSEGDESTEEVTIKVAEGGNITTKLEVAQGNVEIAAGTVQAVDVKATVGENATVSVASGAKVNVELKVAQAKSVEIAGEVPTVTIENTATAPVVTVASTAKIETKLEVAKGSVEVAEGSTIDAVEVAATVSNVTIATAVKTVTVTAVESATETAPVIWVTETGKVTEAVKDKTATSSTSSVTVVAANGQTADSDVKDGQVKVVKGSDDQAIENAVKTPADYLKEKIENGGEITLEDNISGNFTVADGKTVVINLNGKTVSNGESSDAATFTVALGGKLTFNGEGTVDNKTNRCAAIHNNGTLVLNGGTYTRSAEGSGNSYYTILNHGDMTINSGVKVENEGTFSSTVASGYDTWKADAVSKYAYDSNTNHQNPTLTINGGTITGGKYNVKHNGNDGTLTVAEGVELDKVKINDTIVAYVASEAALTAALADANVKTITLGADITGDFSVASGRTVTVNLNGKTITNSKGDTFTVALGGSLTIEGKGTVDNITHGKACIYNNGTVALNGGTYTRSKENGSSKTESGGNSYYNILNHGTMTIAEGVTVSQSGGFSSMIANGYYKYTSTDPRSGYVSGINAEKPSLTISGGSFEGGLNTIKNDDGANLEINGGTFVNTKQACIQNNNYATINDGEFNPTGAVAVQSRYFDGGVNAGVTYINGGTFNGSLVSYGGGIFVFGDSFTNSTVYVADEKSLNVALANARVSTIALNCDITLSDKLIIGIDRTLVIDLNGKTLTGRTNLTKGNVTFKNGKIAGGAEQALNVYGSSDVSATNYSVLIVEKDVTVTADVFAVCIFGNTATTNGYGVKVTLNGTIETKGNGKDGAVFVSGNLGQNVDTDFAASKKNTVWIYGTVTSETDAAVAINGAASVYVQGSAKLTGNTGVAIKRGLLSVTNGTITGNGACYSSPAANPNGTEMSGSAVHASDTYSKYGPLSVLIGGGTFTSASFTILNNSSSAFDISGGSFTSTMDDEAIAVWARRGDINITGGTFETSSNKEATVYVGTNAENLNGNSPKLTISGKKTVVRNTATGQYEYNPTLAPLAVNMYNTLTYKAVEINGGTFYGNNPSRDDAITTDYGNFLADGYGVYELDGAYTVCTAGQEEVLKLKAQLVDDATVTVSESVTLASVLEPTGKNATLVLADDAVITGKGTENAITAKNGLTLKGKGTIAADISNETSSVLKVTNNTVNIEDGVTLEAGSGNNANYAIKITSGTVNISGGYFHTSNAGQCELIYLYPGRNKSSYQCYLNISGGVFECDGDASYMINCFDDYRSICTISITGGTFVGFNPADNIAEGEHTNFCADGYTTEKTTYNGKDAWKVVKTEK